MIHSFFVGVARVAAAGVAIGLGALGISTFTKSSEERYFNKGVCKKCKGHFKPIENPDTKEGRGYKCDYCDNCVWIVFGSDRGYSYTPSKYIKK